MSLNIIGISALYHDSACCLMQDGIVKAAVQEERFTREKNDFSIPYNAFMYCLESQGLSITDIDYVAYYESPEMKLERQEWSGYDASTSDLADKLDPKRPEREIRELLGYEGPIKFFEHHESHAASSFYFSGFDSAAVLTVDGVGEWATTTYGVGKNENLDLFEEVRFPDSIGLLYSTITSYLGFRVNNGEYKVMGLAPYGKPIYADHIRKLIQTSERGSYNLNMEYFEFVNGNRMYSDKLVELFGKDPRPKESKLDQYHADVAKSLQVVLEEIMLEKVRYLYETTGEKNLCMAGGVALNCVANGKILREGPFDELFVQPASNDAGCALGAAALAHVEVTGERPSKERLEHVYLGTSYDQWDVQKVMEGTSLEYTDYSDNQGELLKQVAQRLADGKVVGWFHGAMEFGPRSLGARSILADPRHPEMRDRINAMVKKREGFRPFAPVVLESKMGEHFELDHPSPFMLETCQVKSSLDLPAITHVDNSARVQTVNGKDNPKFTALIEEFDKITECPIVLNTSFNVRGEPIVCDPVDALKCFITTDIDCLVLEDVIIDRETNELDVLSWLIGVQVDASKLEEDIYTFV